MKTIVNKTRKPLKIHLPGGKVLHLGPSKTGQISDHAAEEDAIRRLIQAGQIEIAGEAADAPGGGETRATTHETTHGHPPTTVVLPKGNR